MRLFRVFFLLAALFHALSPAFASEHTLRFADVHALQFYLRWSPGCEPLISAHRGGPLPGFPENCIATFEKSLQSAPCIIECDVGRTADSVLVLMHDRTVDRTTNATGQLDSLTWDQVRTLRLRDAVGAISEYSIPTLADALEWAKQRTILTIDLKGGVSPAEVIPLIVAMEAEHCAVLITYTLEQALAAYALHPELMISVTVRNEDELNRLLEAGLSPRRLVAFVGVSEPSPDLYRQLHQLGIRAILGTMGNLDNRAEKRGGRVYQNLLKNGADIIATDRVQPVAEAINRHLAQTSGGSRR